ncbi:MAG: alpha/beta hydrolase [Halioglobus sp.]
METVGAIGQWIAENESLLSGAAAIIVLLGVLASFGGILLRRVRAGPDDGSIGAPVEPALKEYEADSKITIKMLSAPTPDPVHFALSDGLHIAYSIHGSGAQDILMTPGIISHLNIGAHMPPMRDSQEALASFARIVSFDKRGQGLSDPSLEVPNLDDRVRDIEAVMNAAELDSAVLYGISEGGSMCLKFAHDHPERVKGLVLLGTTASWLQREDLPAGISENMLDGITAAWGTGTLRDIFFPSISRERMDDQTYKAFERLISTRHAIKQLVTFMKEVDVRPLLPGIHCPCLVIHYAGDMAVPIRLGRALAEGLPNAEFLEVNAVDHADLSQSPEAIERIRLFVEALA